MMKILFISTMVLGTLCIVDMTQPANATTPNNPNLHFVRGGGHVGREGEFRREEPRGEGYGEAHREGSGESHTANPTSTEHPAAVEQRLHTLNNEEKVKQNSNKEGWTGIDGGWDTEGVIGNGDCYIDSNTGNLICN